MAPHFLVLTYPAQGHINPALHFARCLAGTGHRVTFSSTIYAHRRMLEPPTPDDPLSYAPFPDGYDDGFDFDKEGPKYLADFNQAGPVAVSDLVRSFSHEGRPITCVIYTLLLPWVADVARDLGIPCCHLWIQPAAVFVIYHHYFHGSDAIISSLNKDPSSSIKLPGLPPLTHRELPSFIFPSDSYPFVLSSIKQLFQALDKEEKPHVLVNTFDALEESALRAVHSVQMAGVGPLIPSAFLGGKSRVETSSDYIEWLESKQKSSVVYVSFGTLSALSKQQMEEIANGLLESGRMFLWVVREAQNEGGDEIQARISASKRGLVVSWCSQVEVLSHPSVGCFVSHCGWNSTTESLAVGVPMVCFPQWSDQQINAKLVEEVWKTGVRLVVDEDGVVKSGELKRCLEEVMEGESGEEMRKNADKWRDKAREAAGEGGSSDRNVKAFADKVKDGGFF
ncbi:crocetin glucosyltransferase, chloroplastic-like protein [Cinnamomum micranthum f. kanehirae]|uniref:Glycosyltransferase n=1 Tax=Cinnamomum micranthum f. kanehirae TaxID=337451 RepID=A0A443N3F4_9MAGN|nr:crocetin glucosyltransferase, chloroplastic-like protein [Cinnamomum micranthum f. kanehirae]